MKPDAAQLLSAARLAAGRAAAFLREQEGRMRPEQWSEKARADFVTDVDREAERLITGVLRERFPDCVIVGEELSPHLPTPDTRHLAPVFVVDPLDGTTNYLHRFPEYAVSIGALHEGEMLAGVVLHAAYDRSYYASRGAGAWCDGERLSVSSVTEPRQALIGTGFPFRDIGQIDLYQRQFAAVVRGAAGLRRPGSAALDLCHVAAGHYDGFWELRLAPWDVAAGILLVREAGGVVSDLDGRPSVPSHAPIVAGSPAIHRWLLATLRG